MMTTYAGLSPSGLCIILFVGLLWLVLLALLLWIGAGIVPTALHVLQHLDVQPPPGKRTRS